MKFLVLFLLLVSLPVQAHKSSDSYLHLQLAAQQVKGQWDIALRDLDFALGLDANDDGRITWGEVQGQQAAIQAYALTRLTLSTQQQPCQLQPTDFLIDEHSDGRYVVLNFSANCVAPLDTLAVAYQLFFDLDQQHRGLLRLTHATHTDSAIFSPAKAQQSFNASMESAWWRELLSFGYEGVWHIWIGYDHLLFLLSLLLPAAMLHKDKLGQGKHAWRTISWEVFAVVGAFTVAHSITLSLAVLGYVSLPSRWVESAIAASVIIAALNNVFPLLSRQRTLLAFGFGLIHGLGIASVLLDLDLPSNQQILSLLGFNLGVEVGQLVIVVLMLPLIVLCSRYRFYTPVVLKAGSLSISLIGLVWLLERSLDLRLGYFSG